MFHKKDFKFHTNPEGEYLNHGGRHPYHMGGQDGTKNNPLAEPVPLFASRAGDKIIIAKTEDGEAEYDNNTIIVMGRDRNPYGPDSEENPNNKVSDSQKSGYSDYQAAGAIDMVVGRGAPYPLESLINKQFPAGLPPLYCTRDINNDLSTSGNDLNLRGNSDNPHPGKFMDASRIYLSQMCDIDSYFKINHPDEGLIKDTGPSSAIMLKSDKLRLHSRRDVVIVAGGDQGTDIDSNGYTIGSGHGMIHLLAHNGIAQSKRDKIRGQTSLVREREMTLCVKAIQSSMQKICQILFNFLTHQDILNHAFAQEIHVGAFGPTATNPVTCAFDQINTILGQKDKISIHALKMYTIPSIGTNFLNRYAENWIGSNYVTVT